MSEAACSRRFPVRPETIHADVSYTNDDNVRVQYTFESGKHVHLFIRGVHLCSAIVHQNVTILQHFLQNCLQQCSSGQFDLHALTGHGGGEKRLAPHQRRYQRSSSNGLLLARELFTRIEDDFQVL